MFLNFSNAFKHIFFFKLLIGLWISKIFLIFIFKLWPTKRNSNLLMYKEIYFKQNHETGGNISLYVNRWRSFCTMQLRFPDFFFILDLDKRSYTSILSSSKIDRQMLKSIRIFFIRFVLKLLSPNFLLFSACKRQWGCRYGIYFVYYYTVLTERESL